MTASSSKELTCLQDFLNLASNRPKLRDVPKLSNDLLTRVRNSKRHSTHNNDLLEFLGDRCVNLIAAMLVERVRVDKVHHTAVRRVICNNDTLGRLSFYLRFHEHATLDEQDFHAFDDWNPQSNIPPPKVLADLFEAYCGAVYLQHGWRKLERWLDVLFRSIIQVATGDFWYSELPRSMRGRAPTSGKLEESRFQSKLLDFLEFKRDMITKRGQPIKDALPSDTQIKIADESLKELHHDDSEISVQLLNFWICKIIIRIWPEYHEATARATHLATAITELLAGDKTMASIARILSVDSLIAKPDDKQSRKPDMKEPSPAVLASALRAAIGMAYHIDPDLATARGEKLFEPLVIRTHDILIQESSYKPVLRRSATKGDSKASMLTPSNAVHDPVSALVDCLKSITIAEGGSDSRILTTSPSKTRQSSDRVSSDAVSDLVGQLQSIRLEEKTVTSPGTQRHLKLEDLFDLVEDVDSGPNKDSHSEGKISGEFDCSTSRRRVVSSSSSKNTPSALDQSTSSSVSINKSRSSGKWKPINGDRGETDAEGKGGEDASKKSPAETDTDLHKPGDTNSDTHDLSTLASAPSSRSTSSDGCPDSGYASSTSPTGSPSSADSPSVKSVHDSSKGSPPCSGFVPRQISRKSRQAPKAKELAHAPSPRDTREGDGKKAKEGVRMADSPACASV
ncbi:hypothetical protein EWM64_g4516 [Hericium alpestre]|uniref:RNase III domain-containing protein n=1 Tax=Hericium alpestre TaxID=135208 RepID=A0A4Y9ZZA8_9AGAM|nr:hypothetical protein EWM64_g4516 [Hericium alpestre]